MRKEASISDTNPVPWREFKGARLFLTGCTGFFGTWMLEGLAKANKEMGLDLSVVLLSRDPERFAKHFPRLVTDLRIRPLQGDIKDFVFPQDRFDLAVHGAADADARLNRESPGEVFETIVSGTRRLLDFAAARDVRRLLFLSSGAVYGPQPAEVTHIDETFLGAPEITRPDSAYGEGKRAAELLCVLAAQGRRIQPVIARCFAFSGRYLPLDREYAIGNFIRDAAAGGPIHVSGDGTAYRSYLDGQDLADWLWMILLRGQPCRAYNVGSEDRVTVAELAREISAAAGGVPISIAKNPSGQRPSQYVPSTRRAREELGLRQTISRAESIRRMLDPKRGSGG